MRQRNIHRCCAAAVGAAGLLLYWYSAYPSISGGVQSSYLYSVALFGGKPLVEFPLFVLLARVVGAIPFLPFTFKLNYFQGVCASITVALVYLTISDLITVKLRSTSGEREQIFISVCGGLIGALTLACSDTFWRSAISFGPAMLSVCAGMLLLRLLVVWNNEPSDGMRRALLAAFLIGLSAAIHWSLLFFIIPYALTWYFRSRYATFRGILSTLVLSALLAALAGISCRFTLYSASRFSIHSRVPGFTACALFLFIFIALAATGMFLAKRRLYGTMKIAWVAAFFTLGVSTCSLPLLRDAATTKHLGESARSFLSPAKPWSAGEPSASVVKNTAPSPKTAMGPFFQKTLHAFTRNFSGVFLRYFFWNFVGRSDDGPSAKAFIHEQLTPLPESEAVHGTKSYYAAPFIIGMLGFVRLLKSKLAMGVVFGLVFLLAAFVPFAAASMDAINADAAFLGVYAVVSIWIGLGIAALLEFFVKHAPSVKAIPALILLLAFVLLPFRLFSENMADHIQRGNYSFRNIAYNTLQSCGRNAVLIASDDAETDALLFLQKMEGIRRDIFVINYERLEKGGYCLQLKRIFSPPLSFPVFDTDLLLMETNPEKVYAGLAENGPMKEIRVPVPRAVMLRFQKERTAGGPARLADSTATNVIPSEVVFTLFFPEHAGSGNEERCFRSLRSVAVEGIVRAAAWKRPVCFTVRCPKEAYAGMDEYLRLDGFAFQLTPVNATDDPYLSYPIIKAELFNRSSELQKAPKRAFVFSGKTQSIAGYEERETARLYRNLFLQCAEYEIARLKDHRKALKTLEAMEDNFPGSACPMTAPYLYELACVYRDCGAMDKSAPLFAELEEHFRRELQDPQCDDETITGPFRYLLDMYEHDRNYSKAMLVLDAIQKRHSDNPSVLKKRRELLSEMKNNLNNIVN